MLAYKIDYAQCWSDMVPHSQDDFTHRALLLPGLRGSRERCRWLLRTRTEQPQMAERWDYKCIVSERVGHHDTLLQTDIASTFWHFCIDDLPAFPVRTVGYVDSFPKAHTLDKWRPLGGCEQILVQSEARWSWILNAQISEWLVAYAELFKRKLTHSFFSRGFSPANASFGVYQWDGTTSSVPGPVPASSSCPSAFSEGRGIEPPRSHSLFVIHPGRKIPIFGCNYPKLMKLTLEGQEIQNAEMQWNALRSVPTYWLWRMWSVLKCSIGWEKSMHPCVSHFLPGTAPEAPALDPTWEPKLAEKHEKVSVSPCRARNGWNGFLVPASATFSNVVGRSWSWMK